MASRSDKTVPNLENATPTFLVDEIERMRVEAARLKFLDGIYKQALKARVTPEQSEGKEPIIGEKTRGDYVWITSERVSADKVKEELKNEPERLKRCMDVGGYWQLNTKPKESM